MWQVMPGNILMTCNQTFSKEELRKKLLDTAREEELEYAYIVTDGYLIYKVYVADGREELVKEANFSDATNIKSFERILGASDKMQIYSVNSEQTTYICPEALLFEEITITRRVPNNN